MVSKGFHKNTIDLVTSDSYKLPYIESGEQFIDYFVKNPQIVEQKGLSLYIYSKDKGRGKTTLAHYLIYHIVNFFQDNAEYDVRRVYTFSHVEDFIADLKKDPDSPMWKATWLVLDDLGNEDKSAPWKKSFLVSSLQRIMHYRRDRNLPTIITSNYSPSDLSAIYTGELDSLLEIKPDGVIGGAVFREIRVGGGEDLRQTSDYTAWPI